MVKRFAANRFLILRLDPRLLIVPETSGIIAFLLELHLLLINQAFYDYLQELSSHVFYASADIQ